MISSSNEKEMRDRQAAHWEAMFSQKPEMFGDEPSYAAVKAADLLERAGAKNILELGGGQGRDTVFLVRSGFDVTVVDYAEAGLAAIEGKASAEGWASSVTAVRHDVREAFPFEAGAFDACYSHMLFCMALTEGELAGISREIARVLKPGGINVYTARSVHDPDCGKGVPGGENLFEVNGFVIHFFDEDMVHRLAEGFEDVIIEEFEEGKLPRKLFLVTQTKA